jgi:C-terminal peptidase prc
MSRVLLKGVLASFVLATLIALPVRGAAPADEKRGSKAYVVLIGIGHYTDKNITSRPTADADAKAFYDLVTNKDYLGVDPAFVRLLLDSKDEKRGGEIATRANILKALHWVATSAKRDDLVLFGFFGQGGPVDNSGDRRCYFATDSTVKNRAKDSVTASEISQELDSLKSHRFCAFLDVNFTSFKSDPPPDVSLGKAPYSEFLGDDGTDEHTAKPGRAVFLATNGLTKAIDLKEHGLFAQVVLEGLKGAADKEGYEPDGVVTVDELAAFLDKEIAPRARKQLPNQDDRIPFHFVLGGQENHFVLTHNPAVAAKVKQRLDKFESLVANKKVTGEFAKEGRRLLERMPKLESARSLRKEYQRLADGEIGFEKLKENRESILDKTRLTRKDALAYGAVVVKAAKLVVESYITDVNLGDLVASAIRGMYGRIEEQIPTNVTERLGKVKEMGEVDLTDLLADARKHLGKREDLDNHKDIDISLRRMLVKLDPHTTYFDRETRRRLEQLMQGHFSGIGVQIRKHEITDTLQVVTPIKDSPAYKAGVVAGDLITKITRSEDSDGKPLDAVEVLSTKGLALSDAVKKILGQRGTKVTITVQREGAPKPIDFEITRGVVELETVMGVKRKADDTWDFMVDKKNKIGYIRLTDFASSSQRDMVRALRDLQKDGMKGFILDLRFDGGGVLTGAVNIANLFIEKGDIVTIKKRGEPDDVRSARRGGHLVDVPMVCLINGDSASASEIVSAALQDHKRAVIMGERSFGKGSVQTVTPYDGGALKLTTASFWRPNGKNLNKASTAGRDEDEWGVTPDKGHVVKLTRKERDDLQEHLLKTERITRREKKDPAPKTEFKDRQLESALEYLRSHS